MTHTAPEAINQACLVLHLGVLLINYISLSFIFVFCFRLCVVGLTPKAPAMLFFMARSLLYSLILLALSLSSLGAAQAQLTSPYDPFRAIAVSVSKTSEQPVCCLRPLPPLEEEEPQQRDVVFLSFEDWKAAQAQAAAAAISDAGLQGQEHVIPPTMPSAGSINGSPDTALPSIWDVQQRAESAAGSSRLLGDIPAVHSRVPLTDRFNYASLDCSARVRSAHRTAKSPSSILSSKKDKYMLSPCSAKEQFVEVELCEDIQIDTVQLANFEFFSGVFKDFTLSVKKRDIKEDDWEVAGRWTAKNIRGIQSFHPPPTLRDFYRYIRIDFHSHYSSEYYCPLSLLRVYGLTHLEHWKWDEWQAQPHPKRELPDSNVIYSSVEIVRSDVPTADATAASTKDRVQTPEESHHNDGAHTDSHDETSPRSDTQTTTTVNNKQEQRHANPSDQPSVPSSLSTYSLAVQTPLAVLLSDTASSSILSNGPPPTAPSTSLSTSSLTTLLGEPSSMHATPSSSYSSFTSATSFTTHTIPSLVNTGGSGGESIYRTIMNRLNGIENNHTLYARYMDQQTANIREVLRRFGEDIGRLEGLTKAQAQAYQRTVKEWERHVLRLELEHDELMARVNHLSEEVILEKRLSIAQLCLLLAVLVLMGFTRGFNGNAHIPAPRKQRASLSMREWGQRTLSMSGDWVAQRLHRNNRGRSQTPKPRDAPDSGKIEFPSNENTPATPPADKRRDATTTTKNRPELPTSPTPKSGPYSSSHMITKFSSPYLHPIRSSSQSRTPNSSSSVFRSPTSASGSSSVFRTLPPYSPRPQLSRSHSSHIEQFARGNYSQTNDYPVSIGPVPRSAKRWARSAHLHEAPRRGGGRVAAAHRGRTNDENRVGNIGAGGGDTHKTKAVLSPSNGDYYPPSKKGDGYPFKTAENGLAFVSQHRSAIRRLSVSGVSDDSSAWVDTDVDDDGISDVGINEAS